MKQESTYKKLSNLASHYDLHPATLKNKLKKLDLKINEHYIIIDGSVRYHLQKVHDLIISKEERELSDKILTRLMV